MSNSANHGFVPIEALTNSTARPYWRNLADRDAAFTPEEPEQFSEEGVAISEASRRRFLSLMAGSLALAGLTGCTRQPVETIMPYVEPPENVIPGKPKYYATAAPVNGIAEGVIVESHLGRPTKVEGNPDHPANFGASSVHSQACLMDLYDPDRSKDILNLGVGQSWDAFQIAWEKAIAPVAARHGAGFRILTETVVSPTLGAQIQAVLKKYPAAQWHQYDPAGPHSARAAAMATFGRPVNTYYKFDSADVVVSLDADFLACGRASTRYARDFSLRRRRNGRTDMNRLYVIESTMTATGGKADHRLPLRYSEIERFAAELAAALGVPGSSSQNYQFWTSRLARDLQAHKGACVIIPGEHQSPAVHSLAHAMNAALGNTGKTVIYTEPLEVQPVDQIASLRQLARDMNAGQVEVLLILGGNPVYNAPADFDFAQGLERVKMSIHAGLHFDETSLKTTWHIPETHFLEDWGDARAFDGTISIIQPLIQPLYDGAHSQLQILDAILQFPGRTSYEIVRAYWSAQSGNKDFEQWWRKSVHDGLIANSALPPVNAAPKSAAPAAASAAPAVELLEISFRPDVYMYDGRYANNMWLQELPHPMTKLTWDNAIYLSPKTAARLHFDNQQHVELSLNGRSVWGSVWILPGQPDNSVAVELGWGRWHSGRAGNGAGFNAYLLRTSDALWAANGVQFKKLDTPYPLATTQMQQYMEGRKVVIENTVDYYKKHPNFVADTQYEPKENLTLYPHWDYRGYAWALSIDLTACVNCQACVIACQAENNIPVVGKEQVLARRAMHWLRIDTYYKGVPGEPTAYYCPVPCMQCENAPCELVCPVQATNHSSEGLNDMVYNRCIGTRYCSNNCPWKVRRFNFFLFQDWTTETWKLQRNPDVSVRSRGVMEKCTYCVQRIREAEIRAEVEDRYVRDGEIQTACQQACPTQAIVFGDKNNPDNRVSKLKAENLNYHMYAELNTRPRTSYLAELRNPNPEFLS